MSSTLKVNVSLNVKVPMVPNFIFSKDRSLRTANVSTSGDPMLPLSSFTDDQLREIGALWTESLIKRANEQRRSKERV